MASGAKPYCTVPTWQKAGAKPVGPWNDAEDVEDAERIGVRIDTTTALGLPESLEHP